MVDSKDSEAPARVEFESVERLELDDLLLALIDRAEDVLATQGRLRGLLRATQAIASNLDLSTLLQRIVDEARTLIGAQYAALGVIGDAGGLVEFVHSGLDAETAALIGHLPTGRGLLGELINHPAPLRLPVLSAHGSSVGFPDGHPPMASFLGVPLGIRGRIYGNLYLTEKTGGATFTSDDEELALSLAAAAAAAIDNARLYESVTRREHWLEASGKVTNSLLGVEDRDEALRLITRAVHSIAEVDHAALLTADHDGVMRFASAEGHGRESLLGAAAPPNSPAMLAIAERRPVLHADLREHDELDSPLKDLGMGPVLAVPLAARDQVMGALVVGNQPGRATFTPQDVQLVQGFATQAALVLLVATSQAAAKEAELAEERARIARDLHDHAIQGIFGVGLGLNGLATRVGGADGQRMIELVDQLDDAIRAIRHSIFALQRPVDQDTALRSRLERLIDHAGGALGFAPGLRVTGEVDSGLSPEVADNALAVVSEALSNVARHAHANAVDVVVSIGHELVVEVCDDGLGIGQPTRHSGLANMSSRAEQHGGSCTVLPGENGGTRVRWVVPLLS